MHNQKANTFLKSRAVIIRKFAWRSGVAVASFIVVGFLGLYFIHASRAATLATASDAENGTVSGNAVVGNDSIASGKQAIQFGSVSPMIVGAIAGNWGASGAADFATGIGWDRFESVSSEPLSDFTSGGVKFDALISGTCSNCGYSTSGVSSINATNWANSALTWYQSHCTTTCPMLEVLNEPGGTWFWGANALSSANATAYDNILIATYTTFHNAYGASSPKILASYDGGYAGGSNWGPMMWSANSNIGNYIDGITLHPYGGNSGPASSALGSRTSITDAFSATHKPVYVTEVGWPTDCASSCPTTTNATGDSMQWSETQQATNVYNFITWAKSTGYIKAVFYYNFRDTGGNNWYGLERYAEGGSTVDYSKKPAWTALIQANSGQTCTVCQ